MEILDLIEKALNIRALYHRIIASNIANAETPNYKEKYIDFREILKGEMEVERVEIKERHEGKRLDGNTVDMERQVSELTENSLYFHALLSALTKRFTMMKYLINEGRR